MVETLGNAPRSEEFLAEFKKRYRFNEIADFLRRLSDLRVLIIGDTIIDEYHYAKPLGMSLKEMIISANYESEASFLGGAAATANHLAGFCKEIGLLTLLGKENSREDFIRSRLKSNVKPYFLYRDDGPTVVIRRYLEKALLKKYFQLYFHNPYITPELDRTIARELEPLLREYDIVLANDFGLGFLASESVRTICRMSKFLAANTQANSSNRGFNLITKYFRADYVCIDEPEIRLATHERHEPVTALIKNLSEKMKTKCFTVTLGHLGSIGYDRERDEFCRVPAFSRNVVDRVGAGDAYFSITSPLVALDAPMEVVGFIGNIVGAIAVTIVGNERSVEPEELLKWCNELLA